MLGTIALGGWQVGADIPPAFAVGISSISFIGADAVMVTVSGLFGVTPNVGLCGTLNVSAGLSECLAAVDCASSMMPLGSLPWCCRFGLLSSPLSLDHFSFPQTAEVLSVSRV